MSVKKRFMVGAGVAVALAALAIAAGYRYVTSGGLIARQTPGSIETATTRWVLDLSVPSKAKELMEAWSAHVEGLVRA